MLGREEECSSDTELSLYSFLGVMGLRGEVFFGSSGGGCRGGSCQKLPWLQVRPASGPG